MMKKLLKRFMKKNCRRQIKQSLELKVIKKKGNKLYVKWKTSEMSHCKNKRKVELNLSNYATKSDLKGVINISASDFA